MSKPRYTAVESQLTTSPPSRRASAMPSALLPVAVGPSTATSSGRVVTAPSARGRAPARPARPARSAGRSAACAWDLPSVWTFVVEERDGEEHLVFGVLGRERNGRIRREHRVEGRAREAVDRRRFRHRHVGDAAVTVNEERDHGVAVKAARGFGNERDPVAADLRDKSPQPGAELD